MPTLIRHRQPAVTNKSPHANNRRYLVGLKKPVIPQFHIIGPGRELTLDPLVGKATKTFTRATVATVRDFENIVREVPSGEARFHGARRVENIQPYSNEFDGAVWTAKAAEVTVTDMGNGWWKIVPGGTPTAYCTFGSVFSRATNLIYGRTFTCAIDMYKDGDPDTTVRLAMSDISFTTQNSGYFTVDNTPRRYAFTAGGFNAAATQLGMGLQNIDNGEAYYVRFSQIEDVTGQSDQAPSKHIETDATSKVKYYANKNANSVASHIVTERSGEPLHPMSSIRGPRRFARFDKWNASTAYAVGDKIIPATGSGPAGGNGYYYECVEAGTSGGSEPTFETDPGKDAAYNPKFTGWSGGLPDGFAHLGTPDADNYAEQRKHPQGGLRLVSDGTYIGITDTSNLNITLGKVYMLEIKITKITGTIRAGFDAAQFGTFSTVGTHFVLSGAAASQSFNIARNAACDAEIEYYRLWEATDDNTAAWRCVGLYTLGGYLHEPLRTNEMASSYDLTHASWTIVGTSVAALDETGIGGVANTASTITDNDGAAYEYEYSSITVPNDSNTHKGYFLVKKDAITSRYPAFQLQVNGGSTPQSQVVHLDTSDGSGVVESGHADGAYHVEDWGDWWRVVLSITNNTTGNTNCNFVVYPARSTTQGTPVTSATGSIIVGHAQVELNVDTPSTPIITTGSTATRNADVLTYSGDDVHDNGMCFAAHSFLSWDAGDSTTDYVFRNGTSTTEQPLYTQSGLAVGYDVTGPVNPSSSPNNQNFTKENPMSSRLGTRWNKEQDIYQAACDGGEGLTTAAPTWDNKGEGWTIGWSVDKPTLFSDVMLFNFDAGEASLKELTAYD